MKTSQFILLSAAGAVSTVSAFTSGAAFLNTKPVQSASALNVDLANGAMSFDRVCREWRCKYTGDKTDSESLEAISKVVDEYLPTIKGLSEGVKVNRLVW